MKRFGLRVVLSVVKIMARKALESHSVPLLLVQALQQDLGYQSTKADPDAWICKAVCADGHPYYEILFVYIYDILAFSHQAETVITKITQFFTAKEGSMKPSEIYLGTNILRIQTPDGCEIWAISPRMYIKNSIQVIKQLLKEDSEGYVLKSNGKNPFPTGYKPKIDVMDELEPELAS